MTKSRVMAFIDGFNLYHAVDEMDMDQLGAYTNSKQHLKWVNLWDLVGAFIAPSKQELVDVYYFSAYATWRPDALVRHRLFVKAIEHFGVKPVMGYFKKKRRSCKFCKKIWNGHEEKETDVNIALYMLSLAHDDAFDHALLLTADTDLLTAVRMLRKKFPSKKITVLLPETRFIAGNAMKPECHHVSKITEKHIINNLLPDTIVIADGTTIQRPPKYNLPATSLGTPVFPGP